MKPVSLSKAWTVIELKDAPIEILDGDRGVNYPKAEEFHSNGYCVFLNTGNIQNDSFVLDSCSYITEQRDRLLRQGKLKRGDIVLTTRGTIGSVAFFNNKIVQENIRINSGMVILRCASELDNEYIYHLFKSPLLKQQYLLFSSGSAQPQLPIKDLRRIKLYIPTYSIQRKIASILSAYDDLIENNKRRIAILEKMAEEIYREWFVRMRFPASAKATAGKPVNSNDSNFWSPGQLVPINRLVKFLSGYSFKSQDYSPSGRFGIVTIKNVQDGLYIPDCSDRIEEPPSNMKKYCYLRDGDILMSLTGNVGRVCRVHGTGNLLN
jgi:type I restriction enzyme S subunit